MTADEDDAPVLGLAVFATGDGLVAEGEGQLSTIHDHKALLEFRDGVGAMENLPPDGAPALFRIPVMIDATPGILLGVVSTKSDAMGRAGFKGVCIGVSRGKIRPVEHFDRLFDFWMHSQQYLANKFRQLRHVDSIGLLKPDLTKRTRLIVNGQAGVFRHFLNEKGVDERTAFQRLCELSPQVGSVLLWLAVDGPHHALTDALVAKYNATVPQQDEDERQYPPGATNQGRYYSENDAHAEERQRRFRERAGHLRFPRPENVTVEMEDYLIGLVELVLKERGRQQSGPIERGRNVVPSSPFEDLARFRPHSSRIWGRRVQNLASTNLILIGGFVAVLLAIIIAFVALHLPGPGEEQRMTDTSAGAISSPLVSPSPVTETTAPENITPGDNGRIE